MSSGGSSSNQTQSQRLALPFLAALLVALEARCVEIAARRRACTATRVERARRAARRVMLCDERVAGMHAGAPPPRRGRPSSTRCALSRVLSPVTPPPQPLIGRSKRRPATSRDSARSACIAPSTPPASGLAELVAGHEQPFAVRGAGGVELRLLGIGPVERQAVQCGASFAAFPLLQAAPSTFCKSAMRASSSSSVSCQVRRPRCRRSSAATSSTTLR